MFPLNGSYRPQRRRTAEETGRGRTSCSWSDWSSCSADWTSPLQPDRQSRTDSRLSPPWRCGPRPWRWWPAGRCYPWGWSREDLATAAWLRTCCHSDLQHTDWESILTCRCGFSHMWTWHSPEWAFGKLKPRITTSTGVANTNRKWMWGWKIPVTNTSTHFSMYSSLASDNKCDPFLKPLENKNILPNGFKKKKKKEDSRLSLLSSP